MYYTPYTSYLSIYPELKEKKFIGGWDDRDGVHLWYREDGQRKMIFIPDVPKYFCIKKEEQKKISKSFWDEWKAMKFYKKGEFHGDYGYIISNYHGYRSVWEDWLTNMYKLGCTPLEGHITVVHRFIIDLGLRIVNPNDDVSIRPHICFFDLETDDSNTVINAGNDRILSCGIKDYWSGDEQFLILENLTDESEKKLLTQICETLFTYDVKIGFNNFGFDDEVLLGRLEYYEMDDCIKKMKRLSSIDYFNQLERQGTFSKYKSKNKKLDTIAQAVIGRGKIPHSDKIIDLWINNKELLKEYNLEDIRLLFDMEQKLRTANLVMTMMSYSGVLYNIGHSPLKLVETFLLRKAVEKRQMGALDFRFNTGYYLPEHKKTGKNSPFAKNALSSDRRKGRKEELEELGISYEIEGGYVLESNPSFVRDVCSFDFNSLYPNVIRAFNICYSTLVGDDFEGEYNQTPNGTKYKINQIGLMPDVCTFLLNERKKIKAEMELETDSIKKSALDILQIAVKILANSVYGVTGLWGSSLFNEKIGNSITSFGRFAIPLGEEFLGATNNKVVIADTDSMYLLINKDDPITLIDSYINLLRKTIKERFNCYDPSVLKMSWEKKFETLLIVRKKMYAGKVIIADGKVLEKPEIIIKGLKLIKSDTCRWARNIAEDILNNILNNNIDSDFYLNLLKNKRDDIINSKVKLSELVISSRLGKDLNEYVGENPLVYVRIAKRLKKSGKLITGHDTMNYVIIDGTTPMQGLEDSEINGKCVIDVVYYYNIQLLQIIIPILEIVFPEINWEELKFPKKLKKTNFFELKVEVMR